MSDSTPQPQPASRWTSAGDFAVRTAARIVAYAGYGVTMTIAVAVWSYLIGLHGPWLETFRRGLCWVSALLILAGLGATFKEFHSGIVTMCWGIIFLGTGVLVGRYQGRTLSRWQQAKFDEFIANLELPSSQQKVQFSYGNDREAADYAIEIRQAFSDWTVVPSSERKEHRDLPSDGELHFYVANQKLRARFEEALVDLGISGEVHVAPTPTLMGDGVSAVVDFE